MGGLLHDDKRSAIILRRTRGRAQHGTATQPGRLNGRKGAGSHAGAASDTHVRPELYLPEQVVDADVLSFY